MKVIIQNLEFDYNIGVRLLKLKFGDKPFKGLEDIWDDIIPYTFKEIAIDITNIEQRRVAIDCLGIERLTKEINPELISTETMSKTTTWVNSNGELETINYQDTYELFKVPKTVWGVGINSYMEDAHFVRFKDTSTDRVYMIWVNINSIANTNAQPKLESDISMRKSVNSIQAIAWTFQTMIPKGGIEKIIRQGDCILIKPKTKGRLAAPRHLTEKEYRELLVLES